MVERTPFMQYSLAQLPTSKWSGGCTTTLCLQPAGATYAERNFTYRFSIATVEDETSIFTALPDYFRVLTILEGELSLAHSPGTALHISPHMPYSFDGEWHTEASGCVRDFNLMLRKDACKGDVLPLCLKPGAEVQIPAYVEGLYPLCDRLLFVASGQVEIRTQNQAEGVLCEKDMFTIEENQPFQPLSACSIKNVAPESAMVYFCMVAYL